MSRMRPFGRSDSGPIQDQNNIIEPGVSVRRQDLKRVDNRVPALSKTTLVTPTPFAAGYIQSASCPNPYTLNTDVSYAFAHDPKLSWTNANTQFGANSVNLTWVYDTISGPNPYVPLHALLYWKRATDGCIYPYGSVAYGAAQSTSAISGSGIAAGDRFVGATLAYESPNFANRTVVRHTGGVARTWYDTPQP